MTILNERVLFITGGSRGIGLAIARAAARQGARIAIAAKTAEPHPKLEGTIYTAAEEIRAAGGQALPLVVDIRDEQQVDAAVAETVRTFGRIDAVINNASAIQLTGTLDTSMKRHDLMHAINGRGTFMVTRACLPHLLQAQTPHVLTISPPLDFSPRWFKDHVAYSIAKYNMSLVVLGMAAEFDGRVAVNALWPRTTIATAAVRNIVGDEQMIRRSRSPEIMADAACLILKRDVRFSGNFLIDDSFLAENGVTDFDRYRIDPGVDLAPDFFVPETSEPPAPLTAVKT